jgi:hypothetical protein
MKHFFTLSVFILLAGLTQLSAQPILTAANSQPQIGDIISSQYAYTGGVAIGITGANQVWDYSGLTDSAATSVTQFVSPASTPYAATFPGANLAAQVVDTGTTAYLYYNATSSELSVIGTQLDTLSGMYNQPISLQKYPLTYPGTFNDSSTLFSNVSGTPLPKVLQLDTTTVTGYGTLKLPGGQTYNNVLQIKRAVTLKVSFFSITAISIFYETPGYPGPLLSYSLSTDGTAITDITYGTSVILPLRFISFTAISNKQGVGLNWQTGDELHTGYFNVQHSMDGSNFTNIGQVAAGGSGSHNYNYTDIHPSQGDNYYRIQEMDIDGKITFSTIARVNINNLSINKFYLLNNPVQNILRVHIGVSTPNSMLMIFDMAGKLVLRTSATEEDIQQIDASTLTPGIYTIQYISATTKVSKRFVKE